MKPTSVTCPVCGAKIFHHELPPGYTGYICRFCYFEHRPCGKSGLKPVIPAANPSPDMAQLVRTGHISDIYVEGPRESEGLRESDVINPSGIYPVNPVPLRDDHREIQAIWSEMILPFTENIPEYFSLKFRQLAPGGLLYLSVPVRRRLIKAAPLPGQINHFTSKNIMFLLEQHGFKLLWRKNRFARTLRIIARK